MASQSSRQPAASGESASPGRSWAGAFVLSIAALAVAVVALLFAAAQAFDSPHTQHTQTVPVAADPPPALPDRVFPGPIATGEAANEPVESTIETVAESATPSPADQSAASAIHPDARLMQAVQEVLGHSSDDYGVVVYRLSDGRGMVLNPDKVFYSASLFKLSTLYEVELQHTAGTLDFANAVQYSGADIEEDLGTLGSVPIALDGTLPMDEALDAMITKSDNSTAHALLRLVGNANVDAAIAKLGATKTSVNTTELPTTAYDMALIMRAVILGTGVSATDRDQMRSLLLRQETRSGIPAGLPAGVKVGNKTGNWDDATHDVAFVEAKTGTYIIAVLSDHAWDWTPISAVSEAVYKVMLDG